MAVIHSDGFKRDAVRISLANGLTIRQVASDEAVGRWTLGKWARTFSEEAKVPSKVQDDLRVDLIDEVTAREVYQVQT